MPPDAPRSPLPAPSDLARHWGLDPDLVFLNHGSFGACPLAVLQKQREWRDRMEHDPVGFVVESLEPALDAAREELAAFVGADPAGLAFVPNATTGVNTVLASLRFEPGDELLTNTHEYNACNNALLAAAGRWGAHVVAAEVPWPLRDPGQVVEAVLSRTTARTRLVMISHVTSPSGVVFPVERIVAELAARGIDALVDGAHAPGMVPLNLRALGAAYYTGNCHKWLCAPKGSGFLHVRGGPDRRAGIGPLVISHGANSPRTDRERFRLEFDYTGTLDASPYLCVPEAIRFMAGLDPDGWPGVMRRNRDLALRGRAVLCGALGVAAPAPASMIGSLATVPIPAAPPGRAARQTRYHDQLQDALIQRHRLQMPVMPFPGGAERARSVRVSAQVYNTIEQMEWAARAVVAEAARELP